MLILCFFFFPYTGVMLLLCSSWFSRNFSRAVCVRTYQSRIPEDCGHTSFMDSHPLQSNKWWSWDFPDGPVGTASHTSTAGAWVRSLVGKLGSHMLFSMAKKKKKIFFLFLKDGPSFFCKWHHGGEQPEVVLWLSVLCITACGALITALLGWVSRWWVW